MKIYWKFQFCTLWSVGEWKDDIFQCTSRSNCTRWGKNFNFWSKCWWKFSENWFHASTTFAFLWFENFGNFGILWKNSQNQGEKNEIENWNFAGNFWAFWFKSVRWDENWLKMENLNLNLKDLLGKFLVAKRVAWVWRWLC